MSASEHHFRKFLQFICDQIVSKRGNTKLQIREFGGYCFVCAIVEIYAQRAHLVLAALEVRDDNTGPVLADDFLAGLMRQSMSLDLSDLMETNPFPKCLSPVLEAELPLISTKA